MGPSPGASTASRQRPGPPYGLPGPPDASASAAGSCCLQRVHERYAGRPIRKVVGVEFRILQNGPAGEERVVVLVEELEDEARIYEGRYDVGEGVVPLVGDVVLRLGFEVGVGAGLVPDRRLIRVEVVVLDGKVVVAEDVGEGVELRQVQEAAGADEAGRHLGPPGYVRQPVEGAEARVHDVEGPAPEGLPGLVDVRADELGLDPDLGGEPSRRFDGGGREVEARDAGAVAGPTQRVLAEVALQVEELLARDVAHLLELEGAEVLLAGLEARDVVELAADVDRDALVPAGPVYLLVPVLPAFSAHGCLLAVEIQDVCPARVRWLDPSRAPAGRCLVALGHNSQPPGVVDDGLPEIVPPLAAGPPEAATLVEAVGADVPGGSPELRAIVAPGLR